MTRVTVTVLCALLSTAALAGCGDGDDDASGATARPKAANAKPEAEKPAAPAPAEDTWQTFTDETHGFSIEAPRSPVESELDTPTPSGNVTSYNYAFTPPGPKFALIVNVTPGGDDVPLDLDQAMAGGLATMNAELVSQEEIEMDGHAGRAYRFTATPQGHALSGYAKMIARGGSLYQVMMVHADGDEALAESGERFVDSFALVAKSGG